MSSIRFRLRYLHHDIELPEGQFAVGRGSRCQLSLDDPLVSRRHAMFIVSKSGVAIEDLQSRNGVIVNGERIVGKMALNAGDTIVIGSQDLVLLLGRGEGTRAIGVVTGRRTLPKVAPYVPDPVTAPVPRSTTDDETTAMARRAGAFDLLGSVAEKALAMGRADEAERLLAGTLAEIAEACRSGKHLSAQIVDTAARFAAKLATATGKGAWADYAVELYSAQERTCPAAVIDELYNAFRRVNAIDVSRLRAYLARLREKQATLGPADRFLLQRIEGLERLAALR
jgi:pSer/pThr/pTyr-binding forkhead associated (FHA) protein